MKDKHSGPDYKFLGKCPICNKKFSSSVASKIEDIDDVQTFYVECDRCASSVVLGIVKNMPGVVTTVGMLTDMKYEDIRRIKDLPPITSDDVLEMHKYLEKSN